MAKQLLGHAHISVTATAYAHVRLRRQPNTIDLLRNARRNLAQITDGLRTIRFHDLRHSTAALPLEQGVAIMELLDHATIGVTADVYSHVRLCLQRQAIYTLGHVLGSADDPADPPAAVVIH
ncbi:hypothetical protein GCM10010295_04530 [Streptomyces intermedius]